MYGLCALCHTFINITVPHKIRTRVSWAVRFQSVRSFESLCTYGAYVRAFIYICKIHIVRHLTCWNCGWVFSIHNTLWPRPYFPVQRSKWVSPKSNQADCFGAIILSCATTVFSCHLKQKYELENSDHIPSTRCKYSHWHTFWSSSVNICAIAEHFGVCK